MTTSISSSISAASTQVSSSNVASSNPPQSNSSDSSTNSTQPSSSSLDSPAVTRTATLQERAADAIRRFENQQRVRNGLQPRPPRPETPTESNAETTVDQRTPQERVADRIREFQSAQRVRRENAPQTVSPARRLLSVEVQDVDILIAERSTARNLGSFINTINNARANASAFYRGFSEGTTIRSPGVLFSRTI